MSATGGSAESVTLNGREFPVTADADITRKLGGFENELQANGNGTARNIKTRVLPAFTGVVVECDDSRGDHEFLQDIADGESLVPIAVTYASGVTYQGKGTIVGELSSTNQNATAGFDIMGEGKFVAQ